MGNGPEIIHFETWAWSWSSDSENALWTLGQDVEVVIAHSE